MGIFTKFFSGKCNRPNQWAPSCTLTFIVIIVALGVSLRSNANITVTAGTGGTNLCTSKAADGSLNSFTTLGNISITEGAGADFGNVTGTWTVTVTLAPPTGWQFNSSAAVSYTYTASRNVTSVTG